MDNHHHTDPSQPDETPPEPLEPPEPIEPPEETSAAPGVAPRVWDDAAKRWVSPGAPEPPEPPSPETTAETPPLPVVVGQATMPAPQPLPAAGMPMWLAAVLAGAVGGALAVVVMLFFPGTADPRRPVPDRAGPAFTVPDFDPSALVRDARPLVVGVTVVRENAPPRTGSGVVLDGDGTIVTNTRLVEGGDSAEVTFASGRTVVARVLGADAHTGLAILRAEANGLPAVPRGSSEFVRLGEPVASVAVSQRTYAAASTGIVSSIGRPLNIEEEQPLLDLMTVEIAGRSVPPGALLFGIGSTAVGITVGVPGAGDVTYALPMDIVWSTHDQIVRGDDVDHPFIGLVVTELEDDPQLPAGAVGLTVADVVGGSPAEEAGIRRGEIIVGVAGDRVEGPYTLVARLQHADDEIELALLRGREVEIVSVRVQRRVAAT